MKEPRTLREILERLKSSGIDAIDFKADSKVETLDIEESLRKNKIIIEGDENNGEND